jgi:hypothetical protein
MTRRKKIEREIDRLAAEITPETTLVDLNLNYEKRQLLYTEWLAQPDLPDTDLMKHQPRWKG